ncbi:hypothetical protein C7444_11628 [Sphaerotilus hippei]|uniref:Uncharacterized protein n=1 Tax=Sphaerotilus hippei TaxID=744406 RepID=A0A318GXM1_9BURK|nr:hypothetical protein [Sphaerotilus hippei]PXW93995.1 hypothetical protein C7444_11628 [Sphaerotilus hippei]
MNRLRTCLATVTLLLGVSALPALASSTAASSASDSASTSVGSLSTSIGKSSESSTGDKDVAAGDYRVLDVATLAERPGQVRLRLQALADPQAAAAAAADEFFLYLPQQTFEQGRLARGEVVSARARAYGLEFARADTREAFYLVLRDDWHHELGSRAVVL